MKVKLLLLSLLFSFACFSQNFTKFRINAKQKKELLKNGDTSILMIETFLNDNEKNLSSNQTSLSDPSNYIESAKKKAYSNSKLYKDICIDCYIAEYQEQKNKVYNISVQQIEIRNKEIEERKKAFTLENQKRDSIVNASFKNQKEKPFDRFILAMDMLGEKSGVKYGCFTIFTNMDEELSRTRFSMYLQDIGYTYGDEKKQINKANLIQEYYVRKVAVDDETNDYIQVKYTYTVNPLLPSYYTTILDGEYPCWIIEKVVIDGTANAIINIYLNYWSQSRKTLGSNKIGEIAKHVFMGDRISLQHISQNKYRIEITNAGMDYYTSYKILERYKELNEN